MTRIEFLKNRMARLEKKRGVLIARGQASMDVNEVRTINDQVSELNTDLEEIRQEIAILEEEQRANPPATATVVNGDIVAGFSQKTPEQKRSGENKYGSMEYRMAFKAFVQNGTPIPPEYRSDEAANTDTLGATIPETVLNEFINEIRKRYGNLYSKVRKLNIKGGVKVPIAELQATFRWVTEATVSPRQDGGNIDQYVEFSHNMAEIRVAQTFLSALLAIDAFETQLAQTVAKAYVKKMETGIFLGTGVGQMTGILVDPRVINQAGHIISMTAADINNWKAWKTKFFAKIPAGYSVGDFAFAKSTVDTYLSTMADANNNPIFREAADLSIADGSTRGRFFGHELDVVEPDLISDYDTASSGDIVGVYWQPDEYVINENYGFMTRRYYDEDRNKWITKATTVVDGKALNPTGFYLIAKA